MAKAKTVGCTFHGPAKPHDLVLAEIKQPTTSDSAMAALRNACAEHAADNGYTQFVMPILEKWGLFRMQGRIAMLVGAMPTRDSAEMRMLHRGQ